ncbi:MAG: TatD family hydrolase [Verrucomicrobia bacterium]|nr:TatD family hydrolase [Verrucomicrobiota bacterium]
MNLQLYDAHNHLHDDRFGGRQAELLAACARGGVVRMVVNGSCEADWPQVLALARGFSAVNTARGSTGRRKLECGDAPQSSYGPTLPEAAAGHGPALRIIPSFGYHPWYIHERTPNWQANLICVLDQVPSAIGEIGLDRWKPDLPYEGQEEVFVAQLRLAAERNLPASIHCLQAWGRMLEILKSESRPARGFLLHSYGGPKEMVKTFADLGGYFSLPGYYAHERKQRHLEAFRHVPLERFLIETDAPDQCLPDSRNRFPLEDAASDKAINHPANLGAVYAFAAELLEQPVETLAAQVEENFSRLFGGL